MAAGLTDVIILGYTKDGGEYFASSAADIRAQIWLVERFKFFLMHDIDVEGPNLPRHS